MEEFSLIKQLNEKEEVKTSPLADGVDYQQYEVDVAGKAQIINIPLREAVNFENAIMDVPQPVSRKVLKLLLREFRGVRG